MGKWHIEEASSGDALFWGDFEESVVGMSSAHSKAYYLWAGWGIGGLPDGSNALIAANGSGVEIANLTANGPTTINKIANTTHYENTALGTVLDNIYNSIWTNWDWLIKIIPSLPSHGEEFCTWGDDDD